MKVIYTRRFPPGDFHGINLFGIIFVQSRWGRMKLRELNHEAIHTLQQVEMGFIGFYLWYGIEFLVRLVQTRGDADRAYHAISFEREAYAQEANLRYRRHRRHYAWRHYLRRPESSRTGSPFFFFP